MLFRSVNNTGVLFLLKTEIIPICNTWVPYLFQFYSTEHHRNAQRCATLLADTISRGLNIKYFWCNFCFNMRLQSCYNITTSVLGIGIILAGRIKGHIQTRFFSRLDIAFIFGSFNSRIIDIGLGIISSYKGQISVLVGLVL